MTKLFCKVSYYCVLLCLQACVLGDSHRLRTMYLSPTSINGGLALFCFLQLFNTVLSAGESFFLWTFVKSDKKSLIIIFKINYDYFSSKIYEYLPASWANHECNQIRPCLNTSFLFIQSSVHMWKRICNNGIWYMHIKILLLHGKYIE